MLQFRWFQHFKALVIAASALFLMGICCGFLWLNNHGFEGEWGERIASELARQGIHAEFESVHFSPTRGIIAKKVLFYTDQSRTAVWARIPVLRFDVDRGKAFRGELQIRRVILSDAHLSLPISRGGPALQISNLTGSASLDRENRLLLEGARGTLGGMNFLLDVELDEFDLGYLSKDREPGTTSRRDDPCGTCSRCVDACPTDAITPFAVDANRCLAYSTIEHRGEIDPALEAATGDWLFGCDICQEVCPHSSRKKRREASPIHPDYVERHADFDLFEVLGWTDESRRTVIEGSAAKRAAIGMWKRNALICAGNVLSEHPGAPGHAGLLGRIREISVDAEEDTAVRGTAVRVLSRLSSSNES